MLQKFQITLNVFIIFLFSISISKAELLKPRSDIKPSKVVEIQLNGLKKNDSLFKDSGIEPLTPRSRRLGRIGQSTLTKIVI